MPLLLALGEQRPVRRRHLLSKQQRVVDAASLLQKAGDVVAGLRRLRLQRRLLLLLGLAPPALLGRRGGRGGGVEGEDALDASLILLVFVLLLILERRGLLDWLHAAGQDEALARLLGTVAVAALPPLRAVFPGEGCGRFLAPLLPLLAVRLLKAA